MRMLPSISTESAANLLVHLQGIDVDAFAATATVPGGELFALRAEEEPVVAW